MRIDSLLKKTMDKSNRERRGRVAEGDIFGTTQTQDAEPVAAEEEVPLAPPTNDHQKESWTAVIDWYGPFESLGESLEAAERLDESGKPSFGFYMASAPSARRSDAGDILFIGEHSRNAPKTLADTMEACPVIERVKNAAEFWIGLLASPRLDYSELDEVVTTRQCLTYALVPSIGSSQMAAPPYSFIVMNRYVGWEGKKDQRKFANLLPYAIEHWDKNDDYHGGVADTLFQWGNAETKLNQNMAPTLLMGLVGLIGLGFAAWTYLSAPVSPGVEARQPLLASLYSKSRQVAQSYFGETGSVEQSLSADASIEESVQVLDRLLALSASPEANELLSAQTLPEVFASAGQIQGQIGSDQSRVATLEEQLEIKTAQLNSSTVELSRLSDELARSELEMARLQSAAGSTVAIAEDPGIADVTEDTASVTVTEDAATVAVTEDPASVEVIEDSASVAVIEDPASVEVMEQPAIAPPFSVTAAESVPAQAAPTSLTTGLASAPSAPTGEALTTAATQDVGKPMEPAECLTTETGETVCIVTMEDGDHVVALGQPIKEVSDVTEATEGGEPLDRQILGATGAVITTGTAGTSGLGGLQ